MLNIKTFVLAAAVTAFASVASADTINFDDLTDGPIANGYHGLTWSNFYTLDSSAPAYNGSGYQSGTTSGTQVSYNAQGTPASVSSAINFTLNSFEITAAWRNELNVLVTGYDNGVEHFVTMLILNIYSPTLVNLNWAGIDTVSFVATGGTNPDITKGDGTQFALDDVTIHASPVPLPAGLPLLAAALGGIGFVARRRRTKR